MTASRSRAGQSMDRARTGVLDGALQSAAEFGARASTVSGIAARGAVAKATVYNHFRTKDEIWAAALDRELDRLAQLAGAQLTLSDALTTVVAAVAEHPARAGLAERDPDLLLQLVTAATTDPRTRDLADKVLAQHGVTTDAATLDLCLRVVAGFLADPGDGAVRAAVVARLAACLHSSS